MDSSNRLNTIFNVTDDAKVKYGELTPQEQVETLRQFIQLCRPYLPYMAGFTPFLIGLPDWQPNGRKRVLAAGIPGSPTIKVEDFDNQTQCLELALISKEPFYEQFADDSFIAQILLLTRKGALVTCTARYTSNEPRDPSYRYENVSWISVAAFDPLSTASEGIPWLLICDAIKSVLVSISSSIERKTTQLKNLGEAQEKLSTIAGRILRA